MIEEQRWKLYCLRYDSYLLLVSSLSPIFHDSVDSGKEGVILSHPHVLPGMNPGAFLTDQDISCPYRLPREPLDTHALSRTVSAITGTSPCFLMCHNTLPPNRKSEILNEVSKMN